MSASRSCSVLQSSSLFESQRQYKKDREAIKLTVASCCDASELARNAPEFLESLAETSSSSTARERKHALERLAESLVDTRNSIAHSKMNYTPTGLECPEAEMETFLPVFKRPHSRSFDGTMGGMSRCALDPNP